MKKAVISKVQIVGNSFKVTYESGAVRTYGADRLPKTVKAFVDVQNEDPFFKDASAKAIFFLLYGSGEMRGRELGISIELYRNQDAAKAWHRKMIKLVHPDNCSHPLAAKATQEVTRMYKRMAKAV